MTLEIDEIEKLARVWIEEYSPINRALRQDEKPFECWEALELMIATMNSASWDVVVNIKNNTDDEYVIANVAAGPLETFIAALGSENLKKIEAEAIANPKFAYALRGVWQNLTPDEVWAKIVTVVKKTGS